MICDECQAMYEEVGDRVRNADVFKKVRRTDEGLKCYPRFVEAEALYKAEVNQPEHDVVYVGLYTPDRWLSGSLEADALHLGEKFEELIEEELVELGSTDTGIKVEHYRDDNKVFVFRTPLPVASQDVIDKEETIDRVTKLMLAYQAAFVELGDMSPDEDDAD